VSIGANSRYAAVMLLSDVRRRLHYEMKDVDLPKKIYRDAQREFEHVQAELDPENETVG
jgi:hypothetical protein